MQPPLKQLTERILQEEARIKEGGGEKGKERQKRLGRMTVRERLKLLLDNDFVEIGVWAAHHMYSEWGDVPAAGLVTGIGKISERLCMIIANDATVKAGAMFPQTIKKFLRAQGVAYECKLPIVYLVDSSGVFLPLQDEIFPEENDFGRIFRNNSILSAAGIPQIAAIMGNCIAGGGYLPVLCDKLLMTEGSGLYLAGPALVKAAIGQDVDPEELGGAKMHAEISGTVDFYEKDDPSCLQKIRELIAFLPHDPPVVHNHTSSSHVPHEIYNLPSTYDIHSLLDCIVDQDSFHEYKADYGKAIVTGYAHIGGNRIGIIANQRKSTTTGKGKVEIGGVLYPESADKAARFVMDCNQTKIPIVFLQDVVGFMVGREAEQAGIIKSGAKLVNAVSNSVVPKITVIIGNSFGAGNYALCGKAFDPQFILAWPNASYAVMGADQAADTLFAIQKNAAERSGHPFDEAEAHKLKDEIFKKYQESMDIRYGAARGWIDAIIAPHQTRDILIFLINCVNRHLNESKSFHTGVLQV